MSDRFKFRTPIYGADGKFKKFVYWPAVYGAPAVTCREGDVFGQPEQCTGLKDKNGRLVYEGDIVRLTRRKDNILQKRGSCFTVRYLTHRFCGFGYGVNNRSVDMCLTESKAKCLEVIGNIHEHGAGIGNVHPNEFYMEAGDGVDEPAPGSAPFCNEFAKCNNAEGCDTCREFTLWLAEREKRLAAQNSQKRSSK